MTIFENNMDFQPGLFSQPSSPKMARPDTIDLTWLTPEMINKEGTEYDGNYSIFWCMPRLMPQDANIKPYKIYIRTDDTGETIEYIDILTPHREEKGEYEHVVSYHDRMAHHHNILIPEWMTYTAKRDASEAYRERQARKAQRTKKMEINRATA